MPSRPVVFSAFGLCLVACHAAGVAPVPVAPAASVTLTRAVPNPSDSSARTEVATPETHAAWLTAYLNAPTKTWMQRRLKYFIAVYKDRAARGELDHVWWNLIRRGSALKIWLAEVRRTTT